LIHGQIGLLLETFRIAFLGGRKVPVALHVSPMFFIEEKKASKSKEPIHTKGLQ
jgi:hypothetical protein